MINRAGNPVVENPAATNISVPTSGLVTLLGGINNQWYLKPKNF